MKIRFLFLALMVALPLNLFAQCDSCGIKDTGACSADATSCSAPSGAADQKAAAPAAPVADAKAAKDPTLTVTALETLIKSKTPMVILDARSAKFDDGKRIPGAKSLTDEATPEQVQAMIPAKDALVVTYCANLQCQASPKLAAKLRTMGYTNVMEVPEGIQGWTTAGKDTEAAKK